MCFSSKLFPFIFTTNKDRLQIISFFYCLGTIQKCMHLFSNTFLDNICQCLYLLNNIFFNFFFVKTWLLIIRNKSCIPQLGKKTRLQNITIISQSNSILQLKYYHLPSKTSNYSESYKWNKKKQHISINLYIFENLTSILFCMQKIRRFLSLLSM